MYQKRQTNRVPRSSFGVSGTSASPLGGPDTMRGDTLSDPALVEAQDLFAESSLSANPDFQALSEKQTNVLHNLLQQSRQKQSYFQFRSKSSLKETEEDRLYGVLGLAEGTIVASNGSYVEQGLLFGLSRQVQSRTGYTYWTEFSDSESTSHFWSDNSSCD